ncbi:MAG: radical SAM protein [Methylocystaceae bacterium]|nr:MAG: radical SAM protein [Methylocystaceae bacterium]
MGDGESAPTGAPDHIGAGPPSPGLPTRKYKVIGLMYTRTCPLACEHCITESSPQVKERMGFQQARDYVRAIARFGSMLCFTGGEPFLYYREIAALIREAKSLGLKTSIVTGAGWVRGERRTRSRLAELIDAGLDDLCISWDQYHEAFSTPARAMMLAQIAVEAGLQVKVRSVISATRAKDEDHAIFAGLPVELQTNQIVQLGRAASLPASHFVFSDGPPKGSCGVVFSPIVEPDGGVYACCGPSHYNRKPSPLFLGDAAKEQLKDILARGLSDPILEIIHNLGPYGLYQLLKYHPIGRELFTARSAYTGICELCLDITGNPELVSVLRERFQERDVQRLLVISALWRNKKIEGNAFSASPASSAPS